MVGRCLLLVALLEEPGVRGVGYCERHCGCGRGGYMGLWAVVPCGCEPDAFVLCFKKSRYVLASALALADDIADLSAFTSYASIHWKQSDVWLDLLEHSQQLELPFVLTLFKLHHPTSVIRRKISCLSIPG
jgi:hypothetical protein